MARYKLKPPILGIDQLSDEVSLKNNEQSTALRKAINVDIDRNGNVSRRAGTELQLAGAKYHSLYSSSRGWLMAVDNNVLGVYETDSQTFTSIVSMPDGYLTSYTELNGNLYAFNPSFSCYFPAGSSSAYPVGVDIRDTIPSFSAASNGNLTSGVYGITYTVVNDLGEESGTGPITTVEVTNGAIIGTLFEITPGAKYRIYMTPPDGEEFYQAMEFDADRVSVLITDHPEGRMPETRGLEVMPYGYIVRAYNSRLFVANNDFVYFSSTFRPHLHNPTSDFIPVSGFVRMIEPVDGGVFVGDSRGVYFYKGDDPTSFDVIEVTKQPPVFGTSLTVPGEFFDPEMGADKERIAVWLSESGYNLGLPTGEVIRVHADQVRLPRYTQGCAVASLQSGRKQIVTPVNSNSAGAINITVDSTVDG